MPPNDSYDKLQALINFFLKLPTREQIIVFMIENIAPAGKIMEISTGILDDDGFITLEFVHGIHVSNYSHTRIEISDDSPSAEALRTLKIVFGTSQSSFKKKLKFVEENSFEDQLLHVLIPASSRRIYSFTFVEVTEILMNYKSFFECLRSILNFWEISREQLIFKRTNYHGSFDRELTTRQKKILEMIKLGRTNSAIAGLLGYSESLIRQETIIIYRKLGISGRRDLKKSIAS